MVTTIMDIFCQSSSVVEQRTHKPLVGSSNLPFGTTLISKPFVYAEGFFVASYCLGSFELPRQ